MVGRTSARSRVRSSLFIVPVFFGDPSSSLFIVPVFFGDPRFLLLLLLLFLLLFHLLRRRRCRFSEGLFLAVNLYLAKNGKILNLSEKRASLLRKKRFFFGI